MSNETLISVVLVGLGTYFAILLVLGLRDYFRFRRLRPTALLTWPMPRPRVWRYVFLLGPLSVATTILNGYMARPLHHVLSLGLMALYFILVVPLARRIELGLYRDGVWAEAGFLPWTRIARMAFRDQHEGEADRETRRRTVPDIVLVLLARGGSGSFRLPVPPAEYGAVRKLIEEKVRARVVNMEEGILGL